jgi:CPA1 family monovalent cation:H+ antiporter
MEEVATVLGLLCLVTVLAVLTRQWTIPYPTIMVLTGLAVALVPGLPHVQLTPEVVFLVFLPPLLYAAAWETPWNDFRKNLRPIFFLAIGLVLATTFAVGWLAKTMVPEMPWAAAFALGAIISPPDAVAATSLTRRLPMPRRIITILEGESLLNDATGLVVYRMAILTAMTGSFSWASSFSMFFVSACGGVLLGWLGGMLVVRVHRMLDDPIIETMLSLLTPYAVYLPCEKLHISGVLAVVTTGLYVQKRSQWLLSSATRLHARSVWDSVLFVLNGLTFIFIGLGLRDVVSSIDKDPWWWNLTVAVAVVGATILIRLAWIMATVAAPKWLMSEGEESSEAMPWSHLWIIGWTGMRGVVSLAAALALPIGFSHRELIIFVVFCVILGTLVLQSLSLPWMIRKLKIGTTGRSLLEQEMDARLWMLAAANAFLEKSADQEGVAGQDIQYLRDYFETHSNRVLANLELELEHIDSDKIRRTPLCRSLHLGALKSQRDRVLELEDSGIIEKELTMQLCREIDLEETRLRSPTSID